MDNSNDRKICWSFQLTLVQPPQRRLPQPGRQRVGDGSRRRPSWSRTTSCSARRFRTTDNCKRGGWSIRHACLILLSCESVQPVLVLSVWSQPRNMVSCCKVVKGNTWKCSCALRIWRGAVCKPQRESGRSCAPEYGRFLNQPRKKRHSGVPWCMQGVWFHSAPT